MGAFKFVVFSAIGLLMFFAEFTIGGTRAIPIQHIVNLINSVFGAWLPYYALIFVILGAVFPLLQKTWNRSAFDKVFTALKIAGAVLGIMAVLHIGPEFLFGEDYLPFLYGNLVISITVLIQVSGLGFVFLMNFGLAEFLGELMQKVMRALFRTPGESSVDAIVSFTSGYTMAMMVTNSFYKKGIYTARESAIIATGFSTVAVSFLMIVSNVLGLNEHWNTYFLACLFVTFAVTAITARIYPITRIPDVYYGEKEKRKAEKSGVKDRGSAGEAPEEKTGLLRRAWEQGILTAQNAKPLGEYFKEYYLIDAVRMVSSVTAGILSIGLIGVLLAKTTPLFDLAGCIFYPFTFLCRVPEPFLAAKAAAVEIAEMFLPAMLVVKSDLITKFTVAVTSVSAVLFFSASIPSLLATDIPVGLKDVILIWIERTILSLVMAAAIAHIFL